MSAVCPSCGVAVVPGYVKCPKCHAALPYGTGRSRGGTTIQPGGTALRRNEFPIFAVVAAGAVALGIVLFFSLRDGSKEPEIREVHSEPAPPTQPAPYLRPQPGQQPTNTPVVSTPAGPNTTAVAGELERTLGRARLWSTVEITNARIDVRSASCGEAAMAPALERAIGKLREAGLTHLRCVSASGAVVFERDL